MIDIFISGVSRMSTSFKLALKTRRIIRENPINRIFANIHSLGFHVPIRLEKIIKMDSVIWKRYLTHLEESYRLSF